jgi:hypothetical protein
MNLGNQNPLPPKRNQRAWLALQKAVEVAGADEAVKVFKHKARMGHLDN